MSNPSDKQSDDALREPGEGESYDANGNIRPVPGDVPDYPEREAR